MAHGGWSLPARLGVVLALLAPISPAAGLLWGDPGANAGPAGSEAALAPGGEVVGQIGVGITQLAVEGTHAYGASGSELLVVDVALPSEPVVVWRSEKSGSSTQIDTPILGLVVAGGYLYALYPNHLQLLSLSNPRRPEAVGRLDMRGASAQRLVVDGVHAYVAVRGGLRIIDVSDPAMPRPVGFFARRDIQEGRDSDIRDWDIGGFAVAGGYVYGPDGQYLRIIDVSDPARPRARGRAAWSGREVRAAGGYAYLLDRDRVRVIDITDPLSSRQVTALPGAATDVAVVDGYAYVVGASRLRVFDVSDPLTPEELGVLELGRSGALAVAGKFAYIFDPFHSRVGRLGLHIADVSDPATPRMAGFLPGAAEDVTVVGSYAYVATGSSLSILDVSEPARPRWVAFAAAPGSGSDPRVAVAGGYAYLARRLQPVEVFDVRDPANPHWIGSAGQENAVDIVVAGTYLYAATRSPGVTRIQGGGLIVIDVSDPANAQQVARLGGDAVGVAVAGGYAYYVEGGDGRGIPSGLVIVDVSDPARPQQVAAVPGVEFSPWKIRVAAADGHVYVLERQNLSIVDVSDPARPRETGRLPGLDRANDIVVAGNRAYVLGAYVLGSSPWVIDVSDPASPLELIVLPIGGLRVVIAGDYAYVAAGGRGLVVVRLTGPAAPQAAP